MSFKIDKDFALLYGILLGDGCLSLSRGKRTHKFISITGDSNTDLLFFNNVVHPLLRKFRGKDTNIKFKKDCNAIEFNFSDNNLFDFIASVGFPIGKKGNKIKIQDVFYKLDLVKYIIQGFMATDGSLVLTKNPNKYYPRIESQVISKDLLKEIYDYMVNLGMNGGFYKCSRLSNDPRWKDVQDRYRFQFNGKNNLLLFNKLIGFVNPKHFKRSSAFLDYSDDYDKSISKMSMKRIGKISKEVNFKHLRNMTLGGVEPPISAS